MTKIKNHKINSIFNKYGVMRACDAEKEGIHHESLRRLVSSGKLERIERGMYRQPSSLITENHSYIQASKRIPQGVICLLSALSFHKFTVQMPRQVWLAIDFKARLPRKGELKIKIVRFSGKALTQGIVEYIIEGVNVKVYNPAKTVADCFKYRHKIGLDVALEALKEGYRKKKFTMDELWKYAKICRVANVMRPYMESL